MFTPQVLSGPDLGQGRLGTCAGAPANKGPHQMEKKLRREKRRRRRQKQVNVKYDAMKGMTGNEPVLKISIKLLEEGDAEISQIWKRRNMLRWNLIGRMASLVSCLTCHHRPVIMAMSHLSWQCVTMVGKWRPFIQIWLANVPQFFVSGCVSQVSGVSSTEPSGWRWQPPCHLSSPERRVFHRAVRLAVTAPMSPLMSHLSGVSSTEPSAWRWRRPCHLPMSLLSGVSSTEPSGWRWRRPCHLSCLTWAVRPPQSRQLGGDGPHVTSHVSPERCVLHRAVRLAVTASMSPLMSHLSGTSSAEPSDWR